MASVRRWILEDFFSEHSSDASTFYLHNSKKLIKIFVYFVLFEIAIWVQLWVLLRGIIKRLGWQFDWCLPMKQKTLQVTASRIVARSLYCFIHTSFCRNPSWDLSVRGPWNRARRLNRQPFRERNASTPPDSVYGSRLDGMEASPAIHSSFIYDHFNHRLAEPFQVEKRTFRQKVSGSWSHIKRLSLLYWLLFID